MTRVIVSESFSVVSIAIKGHADFNPGNDIVCASVSTLAYTLINYLDMLCDRKEISDLNVRTTPGDFEIVFKKDTHTKSKATTAVEMFIMGMEMLGDNYPDNVEVTV